MGPESKGGLDGDSGRIVSNLISLMSDPEAVALLATHAR